MKCFANKILNKLSCIGDIISILLKTFLLILMFVLVCIVIMQVFSRFLFNYSFVWVEEAARYLFIWIIFVGTAVGLKEKKHVSVDFFVKKLKDESKYVFYLLREILLNLFSIIIIYFGIKRTITSFSSFATSFPLSKGWIYLAIPIGGLFMWYYVFLNILDTISNKNNKQDSQEILNGQN